MATTAAIMKLPNDQKYGAYEKLVDKMLKAQDGVGLTTLLEHFIKVEGNDQHGRTYITPELIAYIIRRVSDTEAADAMDLEDLVPMMERFVPLIREKGEEFPDALYGSIKLLASLYAADEEWKKAAFVLASFRFENHRNCSAKADDRVEWHVNTAEYWLECGETGSASQAIKKGHGVVKEVKNNEELVLRFRTCHARVLDAERKFLEAALHYKKLSQMAGSLVSEADLMKMLEYSVTCGILAKAGPPRSRVLATLYSDERSQHLHSFALLEKVFKERIIREDEVKQFESRLAPHQNAATSNGMTVLQNAMTQHNLLACSKIYTNITFGELGVLLGISSLAAEKLAASMIGQGRMNAVIDQIDSSLEFTGTAEKQSSKLAMWDSQIQELCLVVNHILESAPKQYKDLY